MFLECLKTNPVKLETVQTVHHCGDLNEVMEPSVRVPALLVTQVRQVLGDLRWLLNPSVKDTFIHILSLFS